MVTECFELLNCCQNIYYRRRHFYTPDIFITESPAPCLGKNRYHTREVEQDKTLWSFVLARILPHHSPVFVEILEAEDIEDADGPSLMSIIFTRFVDRFVDFIDDRHKHTTVYT